MPNKTIYVPDDDLELFEQAQTLSGESLSATIIQALRQYITYQEARARGFQILEVSVGSVSRAHKRFTGRLVAQATVGELSTDPGLEKYTVYETPKGNLVVYYKRVPHGDSGWQVEKRLDIYASVAALAGHIPDELYELTIQRLRGNDIELLDI